MADRQGNEIEGISSGISSADENGSTSNSRIWFSTSTREGRRNGSLIPSRNRNWIANHSQRRERGNVRRLWSIQSHWRELKDQHGQWTCFFCCHVCTGTIVIGLWHMLLHLLALSLIAVVMIHPELLKITAKDHFKGEQLEIYPDGMQDVQAVNCSKSPCLLAAKGNEALADAGPTFPLSLGNLLSTHRLDTEDVNVALFVTLCTFIITLLMVHGAFRGQASQLMPFFFLQVFDFCISSMTMIGYLSYLPNIRMVIQQIPSLPFQQYLLGMNKKCLMFFVMMIFIASFMVKAYCINIVWRCYKYLMHRSQGNSWSFNSRLGHSGPVDQESQTLVMGPDLPDYDTAITDPQYRKKASSLYPEPPPSYDLAMAALHTRENQSVPVQTHVPSDSTDGPDSILLIEPTTSQHHGEIDYQTAAQGALATERDEMAAPSQASSSTA